MKKVNKALMATVAILLSLVLISTSVLSGVFAKFVDTKSAGATVSLKAFGLTLSVAKGGAVSDSDVIYSPEDSTSENALSATISNFSLNASYTSSTRNLLTFTLDGTPNVDKVKLVLTVKVDGVSSFNIAENEVPGIPAGNHIPVGFMATISPDSGRTTYDRYWCNPENNEAMETLLINGMVADVNDNPGKNNNNPLYPLYNKDDPNRPYDIKAIAKQNSNYVDTFEMVIWDTDVPDNARRVNSITIGVRAYTDGATSVSGLSVDEAKILQTYLAEKTPTPALKVTYTVSIQQAFD